MVPSVKRERELMAALTKRHKGMREDRKAHRGPMFLQCRDKVRVRRHKGGKRMREKGWDHLLLETLPDGLPPAGQPLPLMCALDPGF